LTVHDDDDWTGTPPEGHISGDRARPDFWRNQWQATAARAGVGLLVLIAVLLAILLAR
jgi:hypothetical protein